MPTERRLFGSACMRRHNALVVVALHGPGRLGVPAVHRLVCGRAIFSGPARCFSCLGSSSGIPANVLTSEPFSVSILQPAVAAQGSMRTAPAAHRCNRGSG